MNLLQNQFVSLKHAQAQLAMENASAKNKALAAAAAAIDRNRDSILAANAKDVEKARAGGMKESLVDRLFLNSQRIDGIIEGIEVVIRQDDPKKRSEMEARFVREAAAAGLVNLGGHRLVGGMRASIYNAMPPEGVQALIKFMEKFERG